MGINMKIKFSPRNVDCWSGYTSVALTTHTKVDDKWKITSKVDLRQLSPIAFELREWIQGYLGSGTEVEYDDAKTLCGVEIDIDDVDDLLSGMKQRSAKRFRDRIK